MPIDPGNVPEPGVLARYSCVTFELVYPTMSANGELIWCNCKGEQYKTDCSCAKNCKKDCNCAEVTGYECVPTMKRSSG